MLIDSHPAPSARVASKLSFFLSVAHSCADEMQATASAIEEELGSKDLSEAHLRHISEVCAELAATKDDVAEEVEAARERQVPASSQKIRSRVDRILSWLGGRIPRLDAVVESLEPVAGDEPDQRRAYILVSESAFEFHRFFARVCAAANDYRRAVRRKRAKDAEPG